MSFGGNGVGETALSSPFLALAELSSYRSLVMPAFLITIADKIGYAHVDCPCSVTGYFTALSAACREPIYDVKG